MSNLGIKWLVLHPNMERNVCLMLILALLPHSTRQTQAKERVLLKTRKHYSCIFMVFCWFTKFTKFYWTDIKKQAIVSHSSLCDSILFLNLGKRILRNISISGFRSNKNQTRLKLKEGDVFLGDWSSKNISKYITNFNQSLLPPNRKLEKSKTQIIRRNIRLNFAPNKALIAPISAE